MKLPFDKSPNEKHPLDKLITISSAIQVGSVVMELLRQSIQ